MEESDRNPSFSGDTSASTSRDEEEVPVIDDDDRRPPLPFPERNSVFHNAPYFPAADNEEAVVPLTRDDTWSCVVVVFTFWFFGNFSQNLKYFDDIFVFSPAKYEKNQLSYCLLSNGYIYWHY